MAYTDFDTDTDRVLSEIKSIKPSIRTFEVSCRSKQGLDEWSAWLAAWAREN